MWKESYRIGVDSIDEQHYELFRMVKNLLDILELDDDWTSKKIDCIKAVSFMRQYVIKHFKNEEEYQIAIEFDNYERHKKEHDDFCKTVEDYEKQLLETNYDRRVVANFAGSLIAWLIYHVTGSDQEIGGFLKAVQKKPIAPTTGSHIRCFAGGIIDVFGKMAAIPREQLDITNTDDKLTGEIFVTVGLVGDVKGNVVFAFTKALAIELVRIMTYMEIDELDEMVCSAMAEIANIVCGHAATDLSAAGLSSDITPPVVTVAAFCEVSGEHKNTLLITSPIGTMMLALIQ